MINVIYIGSRRLYSKRLNPLKTSTHLYHFDFNREKFIYHLNSYMLDNNYSKINSKEDVVYISNVNEFERIVDLNNMFYIKLHIFKDFKDHYKLNIPIFLIQKITCY